MYFTGRRGRGSAVHADAVCGAAADRFALGLADRYHGTDRQLDRGRAARQFFAVLSQSVTAAVTVSVSVTAPVIVTPASLTLNNSDYLQPIAMQLSAPRDLLPGDMPVTLQLEWVYAGRPGSFVMTELLRDVDVALCCCAITW